MDLAQGARQVFVITTHTTKKGEPKIVKECTYPLTGAGVVPVVFTDLAVIEVTPRGLQVRELVEGRRWRALPPRTCAAIMSAAMFGLSLVVSSMLIVGVIFLTARDPAELGKPKRFGSRRLARFCLWPIPLAVVGGGRLSGAPQPASFFSLNPLVPPAFLVC